MTDRILLTLPANPRLRGVATLVLGGVGSRFDLPYDKVDNLQLAVLSVLAASNLERVTIEVEVGEQRVEVSVGPLADGEASDSGLRRVLERLVDDTVTSEREGEHWITLALDHDPSNSS
jgi:hypothetical protein